MLFGIFTTLRLEATVMVHDIVALRAYKQIYEKGC